MAEIINLRKARKARTKHAAEAEAAENRVRHGRTAAEKQRDEMQAERARRLLDGAEKDPA